MGQSSGVGELEICDTPCPNGIESKVGEQLSFGDLKSLRGISFRRSSVFGAVGNSTLFGRGGGMRYGRQTLCLNTPGLPSLLDH